MLFARCPVRVRPEGRHPGLVLVEPVRWNQAFDTFLWPLLGFIVAPWTTLMYVLVFPAGINGFDWIWLGLGVVFDVFSWSGNAYTNRDRMPMSRA